MEDDAIGFGKEWQVGFDEPALFHTIEGVQFPEECAMPDVETSSAKKRRRLGESMISQEDAAVACAHAHADEFDVCIFDVLATNDRELAGAY